MAANGKYVQVGDVLDYTATSAVARGDAVVIGSNIVGIALDDIAANATGPVAIRGVFLVTKASDGISQGAKLYWDATSGNFTTSSASGANPFAGYAWSAAASADTTVEILLHPPGS